MSKAPLLVAAIFISACRPAARTEPLPFPECIVRSAIDADPSPDVVDVTIHVAASDWDPGTGTAIHGTAYEGTVPGPVIVINAGNLLRVHLVNELTEATTVHWHGVRAPWLMDGVAGETQSPIQPGETYLYQFVVPDPGLYWFHPHMDTAKLIDEGLYGLLLVKDPAEPAVGCDMPVALDDVELGADGQIVHASMESHTPGHLGNTILANGRIDLRVPIKSGGHDLLRFVNAANARTFDLSLEDHEFTVVGFDGGFLPEPYTVSHLEIGPGERFEVLVDGTGKPGRSYRLLNRRDLTDPAETDPLGAGPETVLTLVYGPDAESAAAPIFPAAPLPTWTPSGTPAHRWVLGDKMSATGRMVSTIDGAVWPDVPMQTFLVDGSPITVEIANLATGAHPMHFHGERLLVVARNGTPLPHRGWKDTVQVRPGERLTLIGDFSNLGKWLLHCHILEHAEDGMMAEFNAVDPNAP